LAIAAYTYGFANSVLMCCYANRYFIVIDDIWDTDAWKIIKLAFMDTNYESRIITTTRNVDVANTCCASDDLIHKMRPLSEGDSQRLFYMRIFANECCPSHLEKVSGDILKKCGGVPLAIITLASHLASNQQIKPIDQWHVLLESIGRGLANDGSIKNMKNILLLSYYDLPPLLKTCFLYLSIFPEDYRIGRDRLIRRWIAEGFFQGQKHQLGLIELGECCFNELVNRSLIQPISIDVDGRAKACIVHDMMLDVICDLSSEENFITVLDFMKEDISVKRKPRRISIQKCTDELSSTRLATMSLSQVRSFTLFSSLGANQGLPLSRFRVLRVLDLEYCDLSGQHSNSLRCVGNLLHLRYLGLKGTGLDEIPVEIGKLQFLQILDLRGVDGSLPASVVRMRNLICLYLGPGISLPAGFGNLTSLQELHIHDFAEGAELEDLRYLTQLRLLSFRWPESFAHDELVTFVESLGKLAKLETLEIRFYNVELDVMQDWVPSPYLCKLMLWGRLQTLPTWVNSSSLPLVSSLSINVRELRPEDINILGTLPALRYLQLESTVGHAILSTEAFPCLRVCDFRKVILEPHVFTRGAMPMVKKLYVSLRVSDILSGDYDLSIWNLPSLEEVLIYLRREESNSGTYREAEAVIMRTAEYHPNCSVRTWYGGP
jgi:hypothetical protein